MRVQNPDLIAERQGRGKPPQPVQIVCSVSGEIDPELTFFRQDVPRWLVTTENGAKSWQDGERFHQVVVASTPQEAVDLPAAFEELGNLGMKSLAVLGGGGFIGTLFSAGLIDELWLTVCPRIIGGAKAPSPVDGKGFSLDDAPRLKLLESRTIGGEVFLHYRVLGNSEGDDR